MRCGLALIELTARPVIGVSMTRACSTPTARTGSAATRENLGSSPHVTASGSNRWPGLTAPVRHDAQASHRSETASRQRGIPPGPATVLTKFVGGEEHTGSVTVRLIPDLGDGLCSVLRQVEEVLLTLAAWEQGPDEPGLPVELAGCEALHALHRVQDAVRPTQTYTDDRGEQHPPPVGVGVGRLLGPDGSYEYRPVRLVVLQQADLGMLNAAAVALGATLAVRPTSELAEAIVAGAEAAYSADAVHPESLPVALVEALARALGIFDLAVTNDTRLLIARLETAAGADVILNPTEEVAYCRVIERVNLMWADGISDDPAVR